MSGWIKLHRRVQTSSVYRSLNSKQRDVMIQVLLMANHEGREWEWEGEIYQCKPGEFITSLDSIREKCASDVKIQSIRSALLKLEKWHFITNKSTKKGRLISICNWKSYQSCDNQPNKQTNNETTKHQQRGNKEPTASKNIKKIKNLKNEGPRAFSPPTLSEVEDYFSVKIQEKSLQLEPKNEALKFMSHYEAVGWKVGKNKMKDWKASVRGWIARSSENPSTKPKQTVAEIYGSKFD